MAISTEPIGEAEGENWSPRATGGDVREADAYVQGRGLGRNELFSRVLQAIIELSPAGSRERSLLESIGNHLEGSSTTTTTPAPQQEDFSWE